MNVMIWTTVGLLLAQFLVRETHYARAEVVVIVTGPASPAAVMEACGTVAIPGSFTLKFVHLAAREFLSQLDSSTAAVVDASYSRPVYLSLYTQSQEARVPLFLLAPTQDEQIPIGVVALQRSNADLVQAIRAVREFYGFTAVNVLGDSSQIAFEFLTSIADTEKRTYQAETIAENDDVGKVIGRVVRPKGNRVTVITAGVGITRKILKAQRLRHVGGSGYANILPIQSVLASAEERIEREAMEGNLVIAQQGFESADTETEHYVLCLQQAFSLLADPSLSANPLLIPASPPLFSVLNIQSGKRVQVGTVISGVCTITERVVFLGNTTTVPGSATAAVPFSANFGNTDPFFGYFPFDFYFLGTVLALMDIDRRSDILPEFSMTLWNFTAGVFACNVTYVTEVVLPYQSQFGVAILETVTSAHAIPFAQLLLANNISTPVIGSTTTHPMLASKVEFPYFIRTCYSDAFLNVVILQIVQRMGWTRIGLLVGNSELGLSALQSLESLSSVSHISIANSPEYRILDLVDTLEEASVKYADAVQHFVDTRARVLVVFDPVVARFVPTMLYDAGLRKGDVIVIASEWLMNNFFYFLDTESAAKTAEILTSSLQFTQNRFEGAIGTKLASDYQSLSSNSAPAYACLYYDSTLTLAYALDWLITTGQEYMDSDVMMKALRSTRFTGCSGVVAFGESDNDRVPMKYLIETMAVVDGVMMVNNAGVYDPQGMTLISFSADFLWPDGTKTPPSDTRQSTLGCPFEDRLIHDFPQGKTVQYSVSAVVVAITAGTVAWVVKWGRREVFRRLMDRKEMVLGDVSVMLGVIVDFVQSLALSPSFESILSEARSVVEVTIWSVDGDYIRFLILAESLSLLWVVSRLYYTVFRGRLMLSSLRLMEKLAVLIESWLFVPVVSTLLKAFSCVQAAAERNGDLTFGNSFLEKDCSMTCWKSEHLALSSLAALSLFIYLPGAIYTQPHWQSSSERLNVCANPLFLRVKLALLVVLISLRETLRPASTFAFFFLFLGIWIIYLLISIWVKSYGYQRTALWHCACVTMTLWTTLLSVIQFVNKSEQLRLAYIGLTAGGWSVIIIAAFVYQCFKVPTLLYRPRGVDTLYLFKFAFQRAQAAVIEQLEAEFQRTGHNRRVSIRMPTIAPTRGTDAVQSEESLFRKTKSMVQPQVFDDFT